MLGYGLHRQPTATPAFGFRTAPPIGDLRQLFPTPYPFHPLVVDDHPLAAQQRPGPTVAIALVASGDRAQLLSQFGILARMGPIVQARSALVDRNTAASLRQSPQLQESGRLPALRCAHHFCQQGLEGIDLQTPLSQRPLEPRILAPSWRRMLRSALPKTAASSCRISSSGGGPNILLAPVFGGQLLAIQIPTIFATAVRLHRWMDHRRKPAR